MSYLYRQYHRQAVWVLRTYYDLIHLQLSAPGKALNACLDSIQKALSNGGKLTLTGFGTFSMENRKARKGCHPQTGEEITIPESKVVKFRPGRNLKNKVSL